MGKIAITELKDVSPFRKVSMGTWNTAKDPQVYTLVELDITGLKEKMERYSQEQGVKITFNHLVGKAVAYCLKQRPEINGFMRGSKIYLRDHVALNYLVNVPGNDADQIKKATLMATTVHEAENISLADIARRLEANISKVKKGEDKELKKNMDMFKILPWCLSKYYLNLASFLIYGLNWNLSFLGIPKDPFGSVMITNVGSLDVDLTWAPLVPYSRVPMVMTMCTAKLRPWVIDGAVVPRMILPIGITFDHRFMDGIHGAQMLRDFKKCFSEPERYLFN